MVGLAGACAEELVHSPTINGKDMMERLSPDDPDYRDIALSETDAKFAGQFDESDLDRCLEILRLCWTAILSDVDRRIAKVVGQKKGT
jgi:hypothetical protein